MLCNPGRRQISFIGTSASTSSQTAEVAGRIRYLVTAVPLIACILIVVGLGLIYNLKKEDSDRINEELKARHAAEK